MDRSEVQMDSPDAQIESSDALFSLIAGEGDGFMLGLAAGDTAGGAWELGYSAVTEQATVIAYELIEHGELDQERLVRSLRELDGSEQEEPVYRAESPHFRAWLDRAAAGMPVPEEDPSLDSVPRVAPIGVAFRNDSDRVAAEAIRLGRLFHADAASVASGVIISAAVAASCFGQSGRDLIAGVAETVSPHIAETGSNVAGAGRLATLAEELSNLARGVGIDSGPAALDHTSYDGHDPLRLTMAGLLLAAPVRERYHVPIEQAARIGGSSLAAAVGAIVGARVGIRAWPWAFANDTWFAEIGRRLVRGPNEVRDLPIPYAVEHHLMSGAGPVFH